MKTGIAKRMAVWLVPLLLTAPLVASAYEVICTVEPDRSVLPANTTQKAVVKVTLDAPIVPTDKARPPVNLCVVIDRSGSMSGAKIKNAKAAAVTALRKLGRRDIFSLVIYDHEVETIVPAQSAGNAEWIESRINGISARGNTALFAGVSQGAAELRKNLEGTFVHRLILLSDGLANVGPSAPADLGRLGASLMKEQIAVTTIGVGNDYNEDLMAQLSRQSDGNTYFVENSGDLPRIFAAELGDVLSVVASDVTINIEITGGAKPLRIIGRDGRINGNTVQLKLNQLYGGQKKYALVEVEVPPTAESKTLHLASATCDYENSITQKRDTSRGTTEVRFSRSEKQVRESENVVVAVETGYNIAAAAQEDSIALWERGQKADAVENLRRNSSAIRKKAVQVNDKDLEAYADKLEAQAGELEERGLSAPTRKKMRSESFQIEMQQQTAQ